MRRFEGQINESINLFLFYLLGYLFWVDIISSQAIFHMFPVAILAVTRKQARQPARRKCNTFENDHVAYRAPLRRRAGMFRK